MDSKHGLTNLQKKVVPRYAVAVCAAAAGLALRFALSAVLGFTAPYVTFVPAIVVGAWFGGLGPGILTTILCLAAAFYSVILPSHGWGKPNLADAVGVIIFSSISLTFTLETVRRKNAEEALVEAKNKAERDRDLLRTTLASIGDAVIAADAGKKVTFLNAVAQELTGWSETDAVGREITEVFVIWNEKTNLTNQTVLATKDGRGIPIEDSAAPIRGTQGEILGEVLVFRDVTDRRHSENALRFSEERLKLAMNAGQIGVWDWDVTQDRVEWSDLVYKIHGLKRGEFRGGLNDFAQLIHPDDQERIGAAIQTALLRDQPYEVEFRVVHPDGTLHWVSTTAAVFRNEQGNAVRMLGAMSNITARKEAEAHLRQQWRTFDTALSHTPDFTYIFDLEGRFTYVNRALLTLWQRPLEDAVGKNFFELDYPPALAARLQQQIQEVVGSGRPVRDQTPYTGPTGEIRYYEYIFVPVLSASGEVSAVAGSTRDTTERNAAEEALRKSEERLSFALEAGGGIGAWDWDILRDRVHSNSQFEKFYSVQTGRAGQSAPIAEFTTNIHTDDRNRVNEHVQDVLKTGGEFAEEYRVIQPDGEIRWLYARGRCQLDETGQPTRFPGVAFDTTERKRTEEELKQSNEELKRANRELEEFAFVASHDLQEPLRMVNIYTQLILKEVARQQAGAEHEKFAKYASFVRQGVTRMEALIQDLLTFSRAVHDEELPPAVAPLSTSLSQALSILKNQVEESGCILTAPELPAVHADIGQMAHVFQNLLSNAIKYRKNDTPPRIEISAREDGVNWIVSVRDNGIGFDPRYAERIFGLFRRLHKEEYPGTGLGLAICRRIVERYGGRIWAESQSGEGATFYFLLPRAATAGSD